MEITNNELYKLAFIVASVIILVIFYFYLTKNMRLKSEEYFKSRNRKVEEKKQSTSSPRNQSKPKSDALEFSNMSDEKNNFIILSLSVLILWLIFIKGESDLFYPSDSAMITLLLDNSLVYIKSRYRGYISIILFLLTIIPLKNILTILFNSIIYKMYLNKINNKFLEIYTFHVSSKNKTAHLKTLIAMTVIMEESKKYKISPQSLIKMLSKATSNLEITAIVNPTGINQIVQWEEYMKIYQNYISFRAENYKPLIAALLSFEKNERSLTKEFIDKSISDLNEKPLVSLESGLL